MAGSDEDEVDDLETEETVDTAEDNEEADDLGGEEEEGYDASLGDDDIDAYEDDADEDLKLVDEVLNHKDENARALAIRRAIEERQEARRISKDLDYLDLDLDD